VAKFSGTKRRPLRANLAAPIKTVNRRARTYEGGEAFERDAESELFLLAATNMVGEDTFYERAADRDARFVDLIHEVTAANPAFIAGTDPDAGRIGLAQYLRQNLLMRSAAVVMAAEYVAAGGPGGRWVIARALQRADEPAELIGYWMANHGRNLPMPVKRGVADAVGRLYNERAALRYDALSRRLRMADVIELTHPPPLGDCQSALFRYLLDRRHHDDTTADPGVLPMLAAAAALEAVPEVDRRSVLRARGAAALGEAGFSWERLSGWLPGAMDAEAWETVIPSMGVMALVRNLQNFDQASIGEPSVEAVIAKITDPGRGGQGPAVPLPGVGGVQERAVGQLEAGPRPHHRPHRGQHPGPGRNPGRDRHLGIHAGCGVAALDHVARRGGCGHGHGHRQAGRRRRRRDLRPGQRPGRRSRPVPRCSRAWTRWCARSARSATPPSATPPSPVGTTGAGTAGWSSSPTTSSTTPAGFRSTMCR
jgi:hypothetical protein